MTLPVYGLFRSPFLRRCCLLSVHCVEVHFRESLPYGSGTGTECGVSKYLCACSPQASCTILRRFLGFGPVPPHCVLGQAWCSLDDVGSPHLLLHTLRSRSTILCITARWSVALMHLIRHYDHLAVVRQHGGQGEMELPPLPLQS